MGKAVKNTIKSFDYQWKNLFDAPYLFGRESWRKNVDEYILDELSVTREWIKNKTVIDVGSGDGRWSYGFVKLGCVVTSVDISEYACKATRQNVPQVDVIMSDLLRLPTVIKEKKFDIVWCFGVIHHLANPRTALKTLVSTMHQNSLLHLYVYSYDRGIRVKLARKFIRIFSLKNRERITRIFIKSGVARRWSVHELFDVLSTQINHEISEDVLKEWFTENELIYTRYTPNYAMNLSRDLFVTGSRW